MPKTKKLPIEKIVNPSNYIKSVLVIVIFAWAALMFRSQIFLPKNNSSLSNNTLSDSSFGWKIPTAALQPYGQVTDTDAFSQLRQEGSPKGLPVRLKIPVIGVDTAIEDAYITPDGRMDVPAGSVNVAWYALGPRPGQIGSAVIGGHFGIDNGVPKVFYLLNNLKANDKVYVVDDKGNTLTFTVRSIRVFGRNDDSTPVFLSNDGLSHLNLITCEGIWNRINDTYPDRRVVFAEATPSEEAAVVKPLITVTPKLPATAKTPTLVIPKTTTLLISPTEKIATDTSIVSQITSPLTMNPSIAIIFSLAVISASLIVIKIIRS